LNYEDWLYDVNNLLLQLRAIDFGYPLGENLLLAPSEDGAVPQNTELAEFYSCCDGLRWPDVGNGYFLRSKSELDMAKNEYDPTAVKGDKRGPITVLGSTGTGILFALRSETGEVMKLPSSRIERNLYDNSDSRAQIIANSVRQFVDKLKDDLQAFVGDTAEHQYLA
jgi:hypothetical protein